MDPDLNTDKIDKNKWLPLSEVASRTPYGAEYLSLLARKRKLPAKKINNVWYTTPAILDVYVKKQATRAQLLNGNYDTFPTIAPTTANEK